MVRLLENTCKIAIEKFSLAVSFISTSETIVQDDHEPNRRSSSDSSITLEDPGSEDEETISIPDQSELAQFPGISVDSRSPGSRSDNPPLQIQGAQASNSIAKPRPVLRQITRLVIAGKREVGRLRNRETA